MRRRCHSPQMRDAARAPYGDNNFDRPTLNHQPADDAARTPHGDSNMCIAPFNL